MPDSPDYADVTAAALAFIKEHKKEIIEQFASLARYPASSHPQSFFMAGSPGAGKTEFSKIFCQQLCSLNPLYKIVRLDADEIRDWIPGYTGSNANLMQNAAALGVQKVFDAVLAQRQNVMLDGTFAHARLAQENVRRSLEKGRAVGIIYIYQDPLAAWDFTRKGEVVEGRSVPKELFVEAFFAWQENANHIKQAFGKEVELSLVIKHTDNVGEKIHINVDSIDSYLKVRYNPATLTSLLHD